MTHHILRMAAALKRLDELCPIDESVDVNAHLVPLFLELSGFTKFFFVPCAFGEYQGIVRGAHVSTSSTIEDYLQRLNFLKAQESSLSCGGGFKSALIFYASCPSHNSKYDSSNPSGIRQSIVDHCPGCHAERLIIAKELIHSLDRDDEKTSPINVRENLVEHMVTKAWTRFDHQSSAKSELDVERWANIWSVELLVRYRSRNSDYFPKNVVETATETDDYSSIASMFGCPQDAVRRAFDRDYNEAMLSFRKTMGIHEDDS